MFSTKKTLSAFLALFLAATLISSPAAAQKKDSKKKSDKSAQNESFISKLPEDQQIDMSIGEMLAAWQIGDVELLHKHIADDVIVVSGAFQPAIVGWARYLDSYQKARARMQKQQIDRKNTLVVVKGNNAWATYQWDYIAEMEGYTAQYQGHTTLVLEKRNGAWLVVHNHTSLVIPPQSQQTAAKTPNP